MMQSRLTALIVVVGGVMACFPTTGEAEVLTLGLPVKAEVSADGIQRATIILDSYSYTPNHVVVEARIPVELTLTSVTTLTPHNFILHDSTSAVSIEEDVGAGKSVTIRFTPHQPGAIPFFCDKRFWPLPSHRDKGMEGILDVK